MNDPIDRMLRDLLADARTLTSTMERLDQLNPDRSLSLRLAMAHGLSLVDRLEETLREHESRRPSDASPQREMSVA